MIGRVDGLSQLANQLSIKESTQNGAHFEKALQEVQHTKDEEAIKKACKEVEAYMLSTILKQMKASINMGEELIPKGDYEKMFESYLSDEQAKQMTEAGGIGLADMMFKQMTMAYEKTSK